MIRAATLADIPAVVEMSRLFYATTEYAKWAEFNPDTVAALTETLARDHVLLVAEGDDGLAGMVGLFVAPFMFNNDVTAAYEVVWYVAPEARGSRTGWQLLQAIEPACRAKGCAAIQMVHLASSPPQAAAIYERVGYAHSESSYTKVIQTWQQ